MKILFKLLELLVCRFPIVSLKICNRLCGQFQLNLNRDLCVKQKKVLFCYLDVKNVDEKKVLHANFLHANQMIKCFIDLNYCVDVCRCDNRFAYEIIKNRCYDVVLGQGDIFKKICLEQKYKNSKKILFVTECYPSDVADRYEKRIKYFQKRHPSINFRNAIVRNGYFDADMFFMSDCIIAMNSNYNLNSMRMCNSNVFSINCNMILNEGFVFDECIDVDVVRECRKNFLWFGSGGFIHKGADLAIDAFKELPFCTLDFYGINSKEQVLFDKLKCPNMTNHGFINVQSKEFIEKVVKKHSFLLFPSCSEGMSTAVATCMAHGIVPIITKECGFEPNEYMIELENDCVETIKTAVLKILSLSDYEIFSLRKGASIYAREHFSLKAFDSQFRNVIKKIFC